MKSSYLIAGLVALASAGWIMSGQIEAQEETAPPAETTQAPETEAVAPQVRVRRQTAEPRMAEILLRGRTAASRIVELSAETRGQVAEVLVEKGAVVAAGDPLIRLAMDNREAQLRQAKALLEQRRIEFKAATQLSEKGFRAETALAEAKANLEEAAAAVDSIEIDIGYTTILAPFDGIVDARPVEVGDFVDVGDPVATLVDLDPILIVGQISERDIRKVTVGAPGSARFVSGDEVSGTVRYISAVADESTRTFRIELEVANAGRRIVQGLSSEMRLPVAELPVHHVSPAILTLADNGEIGVKTVNADNIVEFQPVTIIDDEPGGVWIAGLAPTVTFITVGQEFVGAGQRVTPVPEDGGESS